MPTLADIATALGLPPPTGGQRHISGVNTLEAAGADEISFLSAESFLPQFRATRAAAVIVQRRVKLPQQSPTPVLPVDDADLAIARVLELFAPPVPHPPAGVIVGDDVVIGDHCQLFPNVVVRERITIGSRVIIHAGSVLGTDGFGYRWDGRQHVKIPQVGTVIIEDDVEIGSCVCIDRAKFGSTRVGRGTKIDNLVQIAHNVQIGSNCIVVGQAGLAGSVTLGERVMLGGQSAIRDHITLRDGAMVAACSGVAEDVAPQTQVSGLPALPHRQSLREQAALRRLPDLVAHVRRLQEELDKLKAK